jgi:beta-glucuronidase
MNIHSLTKSLNGYWDFSFLGTMPFELFSPASVKEWEKVPVPSAFDALPDHASKRGAAAYRTRVTIPAGHAALLEFGAVSMWCRVFVDGVALKDHACGYAPFTVEVPASSDRVERELVVLVDNRYDFERVPMHEEYFDFYQYGGIIRPVTLRVLPADGLFIDHVQTVVAAGYREGRFAVNVWLRGADGPVDLVTRVDGEEAIEHRGVAVKEGMATLQLTAEDKRPWSPDSPVLHTLCVTLANGYEVSVRFGLRHIEARAGGIWLNGEKILLKGYNRHEWHPTGGPVTSVLEMFNDV